MKSYAILLLLLGLTATFANAQFPIKISKIKVPRFEQPKSKNKRESQTHRPTKLVQNNSASHNSNSRLGNSQNRQMVMDDGVTFFDARPVKEYDKKLSRNKDIGWRMKADLRILGTFPKRSAFKIVVKKNGKVLATIRCEGRVYTKANDSRLRSASQRKGKDLSFEDYMAFSYGCEDKNAVVKEIGNLDVEIYFIDGDSDVETLVRTYKIDVRKATKVRGGPRNSVPDVADYYIQRHAEESVAIAYFGSGNASDYFGSPQGTHGSNAGKLTIYTTYSPAEGSLNSIKPFVRCSVNGQRLKLERDRVTIKEDQGRREMGIYIDRKTAKYKNQGNPYKDWIEFVGLDYRLPLYTGKTAFPFQTRIEDHPGKWECSVIGNGKIYRTFRWEVVNGKMVPHGEQQNGNVNLFHKAALIDMEIPAGGSPLDFRLMPMPNAGLFYGIPWTSAEGKAMAARVPKLGNPYPVPSNKAK